MRALVLDGMSTAVNPRENQDQAIGACNEDLALTHLGGISNRNSRHRALSSLQNAHDNPRRLSPAKPSSGHRDAWRSLSACCQVQCKNARRAAARELRKRLVESQIGRVENVGSVCRRVS
jgi:hypothetical protein